MLVAGLEGIKNKIMPPEPIEKDIFRMSVEERKASGIDSLPENLGQALDCMRESEMMRKALGDHLFEHFLHIKGKEWQAYRAQVMDWEIKNLLPAL
jgi:glutamine synthetase